MRINKKIKLAGICTLILTVTALSVSLIIRGNEGIAAIDDTYDDLHVCAMHAEEASEGPGTCSICNMKLSPVIGHKHGASQPTVENLYVSQSDPMFVHEGPGKDPETGKDLIPITSSPIYAASSEKTEQSNHKRELSGDQETSADNLWTCGMHPDVLSEEPGICPICQMELTQLKSSTTVGGGAAVQIDPITLQNIGVVTNQVQRRDLSKEIDINGIITSAEDAQYKLSARVSGWVEKLYVARTGDSVRKRQPLLEIYSPELVTAQEEFLLALQSASTFSSGSLSKYADSGNELVIAARKRLELWDITPAQINDLEISHNVTRTMTLVSPADGIVMHKNVVEGSAIKSGMDLFFIVDLSEVWMRGQVYEYETPWVHVGEKVEVTSPYDPSIKVFGHIDFIYPTLDPKNRSVDIRVILPNPNLQFKPEMFVNAIIKTLPKINVIAVQKSAVLRSGKRDIVFVAKGDGIFEPRQVHVGLETDLYYEIPHGLEAGEEIVLSAQFLLDSEAKLQEALQRRLQMRRDAGKSEKKVTTDAHAGHRQ